MALGFEQSDTSPHGVASQLQKAILHKHVSKGILFFYRSGLPKYLNGPSIELEGDETTGKSLLPSLPNAKASKVAKVLSNR